MFGIFRRLLGGEDADAPMDEIQQLGVRGNTEKNDLLRQHLLDNGDDGTAPRAVELTFLPMLTDAAAQADMQDLLHKQGLLPVGNVQVAGMLRMSETHAPAEASFDDRTEELGLLVAEYRWILDDRQTAIIRPEGDTLDWEN